MTTVRLAVLAASVLLPLPLQAQANWKNVSPTTSPSPRELQTMAFDIVQQGVILFGGWGSGNLGDTWLWDGAKWTQASLTTNPPARHMSAMTSYRIGALMFGGYGSASLADTWEWSLGKWILKQPTTSPPARAGHAMAYDTSRQRAVLFGGTGSTVLGDTWEWNGTNWTKLSPKTSPGARTSHTMAYDIARKVTVLFGGKDSLGTLLGDTWEFDGTDWTKRSPKTSPSARWFLAMTYDALRARTVLFGGDASAVQGDTWEWDGTDWLLRKPATSPAARRWHVATYDERRAQVVLFGGNAGTQQNDTWVYGTPNPARYTTLGTGCAGNAGVPALAALPGDLPWIGSTFRVRLTNLPASGPALMVLGISKTVWGTNKLPMDLKSMRMPGCTLYVSLDLMIPIANTGGSAVWTVGLPNAAALIGIPFYNQGIVDAPGKNGLSVVVSNAAEGRVGAR